jgi:hypothetical protein
VFFVDCGYLLRLAEQAAKPGGPADDYRKVTDQLKRAAAAGHDLQLHIHPHWEDARYAGGRWVFDLRRYKLSDFPDAEIPGIVRRYKDALQPLAANPVQAFRAGGWCLQPFGRLKAALRDNGIVADSSVFRGGHYRSAQYDYDFREAPVKSPYRFGDDPVREDPAGDFVEYPIGSLRTSPLFFWRLFLLGRLDPRRHKPLGDGRPMPAPGQRRRLLTRCTPQCVSIDGYNARRLPRALGRYAQSGQDALTVIGHPKALSRYSLEALGAFAAAMKPPHRFVTFTQLLRA